MTNNWVVVTFKVGAIPDTFFPSNIFPEAIKATRLSYKHAEKKPPTFWNNKKVIFHMADRAIGQYKPWYKKVIKNSKIIWWKFACGTGATNMCHYDNNPQRPAMSHYRMMADLSPNFLWEMPMNYEMFYDDIVKVPLTLYDAKYQKPIRNDKPIDFLFMMDDRLFYNYVKTLKVAQKLKEDGYSVHAILINCQYTHLYHKKIGIPTTVNKKNLDGQKIFHRLANKSKIMIDMSFRWTYGRVIYEALFESCVCLGTHTYGAMEQLFPDLIMDSSNYNMKELQKFCVETLNKWSPIMVRDYRKRALQVASPQKFNDRLNRATNLILNGQNYEFKGYK